MKKMAKHFIGGIHITDRVAHAAQVQEVLTEFGSYIKTRLGLHELSEDFSSPNGMLLIEFADNEAKFNEFIEKINTIKGVEAKQMVFDHS
ncbi:MAG: hypothetical protein RBT80_04575 [Candidatus Vecturithrix sp.]|jgi:hypothetical protein|nr:hypothetical protein [Candidatus Vecturithrix sp.]